MLVLQVILLPQQGCGWVRPRGVYTIQAPQHWQAAPGQNPPGGQAVQRAVVALATRPAVPDGQEQLRKLEEPAGETEGGGQAALAPLGHW